MMEKDTKCQFLVSRKTRAHVHMYKYTCTTHNYIHIHTNTYSIHAYITQNSR